MKSASNIHSALASAVVELFQKQIEHTNTMNAEDYAKAIAEYKEKFSVRHLIGLNIDDEQKQFRTLWSILSATDALQAASRAEETSMWKPFEGYSEEILREAMPSIDIVRAPEDDATRTGCMKARGFTPAVPKKEFGFLESNITHVTSGEGEAAKKNIIIVERLPSRLSASELKEHIDYTILSEDSVMNKLMAKKLIPRITDYFIGISKERWVARDTAYIYFVQEHMPNIENLSDYLKKYSESIPPLQLDTLKTKLNELMTVLNKEERLQCSWSKNRFLVQLDDDRNVVEVYVRDPFDLQHPDAVKAAEEKEKQAEEYVKSIEDELSKIKSKNAALQMGVAVMQMAKANVLSAEGEAPADGEAQTDGEAPAGEAQADAEGPAEQATTAVPDTQSLLDRIAKLRQRTDELSQTVAAAKEETTDSEAVEQPSDASTAEEPSTVATEKGGKRRYKTQLRKRRMRRTQRQSPSSRALSVRRSSRKSARR